MHQLYTLVVEPIRDPRLGRNEEAFSEDPYLCARIAETIVRARRATTFRPPTRSSPGSATIPGRVSRRADWSAAPWRISERILREVFLPPWEAGIKAGALGVMATYPAIDGVPTHASAKILTHILRKELGFEGLVLSEGGGIGTLVDEHVAATQKEAGQIALRRASTSASRTSRAT